MELEVTSTTRFATPVAVAYNALSTAVYDGFIYAGVILILVYALIIFDVRWNQILMIILINTKDVYNLYEMTLMHLTVYLQLVHRTVAAMAGSLAALAVLAAINDVIYIIL